MARKSEYAELLLQVWREDIKPEEGKLRFEREMPTEEDAERVRAGFIRAKKKLVRENLGTHGAIPWKLLQVKVKNKRWIVLDWAPKRGIWGSEAEEIPLERRF